MLRKLILLAAMTGLLAGCVSMSEDDCLAADWRSIGASDGAAGAGYDRLQTRVNQCREFGVEADISRYNQGYEDGLQSYCTPANGFRVGRAGSSYNGVCPAELETAGFLDAYYEGRELNRLESDVQNAIYALDRVYDEIDERDDEIDDLRKRQRDPDTRLPEDEYEDRVDDLRDEIRELRRRIPYRQADIDFARAALNAFAYRRW